MNALLETMRQVLRERHKEIWCISFKAENSSQDSVYGVSFTVIIAPETDAVLKYEGYGANFDDAIEMLRRNVIGGYPKENAGVLG